MERKETEREWEIFRGMEKEKVNPQHEYQSGMAPQQEKDSAEVELVEDLGQEEDVESVVEKGSAWE